MGTGGLGGWHPLPPVMGGGVWHPRGRSENQTPPAGGGRKMNRKNTIGKYTLPLLDPTPPNDPDHSPWGSECAHVCYIKSPMIKSPIKIKGLECIPWYEWNGNGITLPTLAAGVPPTQEMPKKTKDNKLVKIKTFAGVGRGPLLTPYKIKFLVNFLSFCPENCQ